MAIKTLTTSSGKTIEVELVREVRDKVAFADGDYRSGKRDCGVPEYLFL